jgi:hypothetical protein
MRRLFKHGHIQRQAPFGQKAGLPAAAVENMESPPLFGKDNGEFQKGFQVGDWVSFR